MWKLLDRAVKGRFDPAYVGTPRVRKGQLERCLPFEMHLVRCCAEEDLRKPINTCALQTTRKGSSPTYPSLSLLA